MKKIIGICNNKGGVGKTTICFCLAGAFAEIEKKVLVVDMDQQGSLSSSFISNIHTLKNTVADIILSNKASVKKSIHKTKIKGIDIIPANLTLGKIETELLSDRDSHYFLSDRINEIKKLYDVILIDAPPNLGLATWSVFTASDGVIVPLEPQDYSVKGTGSVHGAIEKVRKRANPNLSILGYLINRYDGRRRIEQDFRAMIEKHLGERVFKHVIKDSVKYVESVTLGKPITDLSPKSEQSIVFRKLRKEVLDA